MEERPTTTTSGGHRNMVRLAAVHGLYALLGGLWPLISMDSFERITGPKQDEWLVRSVAGILVVLGGALFHGSWKGRIDGSLRLMAGGISFVLGVVALVSSLAGWISWKYMIDGIVHMAFAFAWGVLASWHLASAKAT